jgi:hypothetical protein
MYFINIVGSNKRDLSFVRELQDLSRILDANFTNIEPSCISREPTNQMPSWRFEVQRMMNVSHPKIIINHVGVANCDEITDLTRSIRALSSFYNPVVLTVLEQDLSCSQVNGKYSFDHVKNIVNPFS